MNTGTCYVAERKVAFRDTDAAGIMHFSVFFVWMEETEHEFLRARGLSVMMREGDSMMGWPRVSATCDYLRPIRFEEHVKIAVSIERIGTKSLTYGFRFESQGHEVARGKLVAVCCQVVGNSVPQPIAIPAEFLDRLLDARDDAL